MGTLLLVRNPVTSTLQLTVQQRRVLQLIAWGCSTKQIAHRLRISPRTVEWHTTRLLGLFEAPNRAALVFIAGRRRYVRLLR